MSRFELILLCLCLGACSADVPRPDPLTLAGLQNAGFALIRDGAQFQEVVVGEALAGEGYRARVMPDGTLGGLYHGQSFRGIWIFTEDGRYCQSLTADLRGPASACYWVAARAGEIRLIPAPRP
ncbi:hypothetical protein [Mangrovicoccus algicola]|uniref:Uncharacterized protein n=1 Tax=Mangrovicoccus algicola TaxID=2771008 RepID=A0A8J7D0R5_9RHOB|nr:hypothetical protein [Mangrovicoccus algicola]MBE3639838.1 hypothetical protein [Mangrovicoccus algicola]